MVCVHQSLTRFSTEALLTREQLRLRLNERGYPLSQSYFNKISLPSINAGRQSQSGGESGPSIVSMKDWLGLNPVADRHPASSLRRSLLSSPLAGITERAGLKRTSVSKDSRSHPESQPTTKIYRGQRYELVGTEPL